MILLIYLDDKEDKVIRNLCKSVYLKEEDYKN